VKKCCFAVGVISFLVSFSPHGARADGAYQWTEDRRKALVWNNDPKPGDVATWSGKRDEQGYATGRGTLSWSHREKTFLTGSNLPLNRNVPISHYSGTMDRGKFGGQVETVDHGKAYHANFADGQRKGAWHTGPAPVESAVVESKPSEPGAEKTTTAKTDVAVETSATTAPASKSRETPEENSTSVASPAIEAPSEGPSEAKAAEETSDASDSQNVKEKTSQPLIAQAVTSDAEETASPHGPVTKRAALAPGAVRAIEQPERHATNKSQGETVKKAAREKTEEPKTAKANKPAKAATSPEKTIETQNESPAEGPNEATAESAKASTSEAAQPLAEQTPVDDSIRTLTGPPPSLHTNAAAAAAQPNTPASNAAPASSSPSVAKLTAVEAMDIADIEARTKGYDLGDYQLPKADYNAANDTWSVTYVARGTDKKAQPLSAVVHDKTGKVEIKK
jgi:hypothetical protein